MPTFLAKALSSLPSDGKKAVVMDKPPAVSVPRDRDAAKEADTSPIWDISPSKLADTLAQRLEQAAIKSAAIVPQQQDHHLPETRAPCVSPTFSRSPPPPPVPLRKSTENMNEKEEKAGQWHAHRLSIATDTAANEQNGGIGQMSIWLAAEEGNVDVFTRHLHAAASPRERFALVNARDPSTGASLLHLVITHANPPLTAFSVTSGTTSNHEVSSPAAMPPHLRAHESRLAIVKLLLQNGADASATNVYSVQAIHMVALHFPYHAVAFLQLLLDHGASVHARDGDGWTPLHYATRFCQPPDAAIKLLVQNGADVNAIDDSNHKSCLYGLIANADHLSAFQWLVDDANANVQSRGLFTFFASQSNATAAHTSVASTSSPSSSSAMQSSIIEKDQNLHKENSSANNAPHVQQHQASLVFQAVKYARIHILRYLVDTKAHRLRHVVSMAEIDQAKQLLYFATTITPPGDENEQKSSENGSDSEDQQEMTEQQRALWHELERLRVILEKTPQSLVQQSTKRALSASSTRQRRSSVLCTLGRFLMRHKRP